VVADDHVIYGQVLQRLGRHDQARAQFARGAEVLMAEGHDGSGTRAATLAVVRPRLGDEDAARRLLAESRANRPDVRFYAATTLIDHAVAEMVLGDHDAAVQTLALLVEREYFMPLSVADLLIDPLWDSLREHPGFIRLLRAGGGVEG